MDTATVRDAVHLILPRGISGSLQRGRLNSAGPVCLRKMHVLSLGDGAGGGELAGEHALGLGD